MTITNTVKVLLRSKTTVIFAMVPTIGILLGAIPSAIAQLSGPFDNAYSFVSITTHHTYTHHQYYHQYHRHLPGRIIGTSIPGGGSGTYSGGSTSSRPAADTLSTSDFHFGFGEGCFVHGVFVCNDVWGNSGGNHHNDTTPNR